MRSSDWNPKGVSVRLYAPERATAHAKSSGACASRLDAMKAPYECPPTATRAGSQTPRRAASSTAARAPATSCSTYESLGSTPLSASPMMGSEGPSRTAYPRASHTKGDIGEMDVNRLGESRSCPAASALLNSRGYAHMTVGSGPSRSASYPGGVYSVAFKSTPSARLYLRIRFGGSTSEGCGCGKSLSRRGASFFSSAPPSSSE